MATATYTLTGDDKLFRGYRYAEIQIKPVGFGSREVTLTLTNADISKEFKVTVGADGTTAWYRFDTASPTNLPANGTPTDRDSTYPRRPMPNGGDGAENAEPDDDASYLDVAVTPGEDGTDPDVLERQRTWIWGANDADTLTVSCTLGTGETLQIGGVRSVRIDAPTITLSEGFTGQGKILQDGIDCPQAWKITAFGGRTTEVGAVWAAPFFYVAVDGRRVYDLPVCGYRQFVVGGYEWAYDTASTVAANLAHLPGWTCSDSGSSNFYGLGTGSEFSGALLGGGGISYDGTFVVWIDKALQAVPIQDRYDWVYCWPTAGDVFGFGSEETDKAVVLPCGKILGNRTEGLVLQDDASATPGEPFAGAVVKNYRQDLGVDAEFGTATTDAQGSFTTDVTSGPIGTVTVPTDYLAGGDQAGRTELVSGSHPLDASYFRARFVLRTGFRGVLPSGAQNPHLAVDPLGGLYLAYGSNGSIRAKSAKNGYPDWLHDSEIDPGPSAFRPRLATFEGVLICAYEKSGSCKYRLSSDGGRTWQSEIDMGFGYRPEPAASHTAGLVLARLESVGGSPPKFEVYVRSRTDAAGIVFSSETLVTDEAGNPVACELEGWGGIVAPWGLSGGWLLTIVPYGESGLASYVSNERKALTFKRVP